jgi:exonuclease III
MKIISWNCHGKFRSKFPLLQEFAADLFIIQECENPQKHKEDFAPLEMAYLWRGEKDHKGLGIFARPGVEIKENPWESYCLRNFLPVRVNDSFDLLGVWACAPYIEEYYIYQAINYHHYRGDTVIMGDFNSNAKWDKKHGKRSHSAIVESLEKLGLVPAYHYCAREAQGQESKNTFYLHFDKAKGYHIDHCFAAPERIVDFVLPEEEPWLRYSDHLPLLLEIRNPA